MKVKEEDLRRELQIALGGKDSHSHCASRLGITTQKFEKYLFRARVHGIDAVLHSNTAREHTDEFKLKVVHSVVLEGKTKQGTATKYNLMYGTVDSWVKKCLEGGEELLLSDRRGRKGKKGRKPKPKLEDFEAGSLEYYKLKSEQLERENLLLKKALPLVQAVIRNRSKEKNDTSSSKN
jgi:transposase